MEALRHLLDNNIFDISSVDGDIHLTECHASFFCFLPARRSERSLCYGNVSVYPSVGPSLRHSQYCI